MRSGAFEVKAIAGLKAVVAVILEPNFKFAAEHVKKLFAFVGVGFATVAAGFDAEEVRLHGGVPPSEKLHANFGTGFEDFALGRTNEELAVAVGFKHGKDIGPVKTSDALKGGDRGTHLATLESAEEADGDIGGAGNFGERKTPLEAQAAKALARRVASVGRSSDQSLFFQNMNNGGRIEAASATKKERALKEAQVSFGIHTITAGRAPWSNESKSLPSA
jgi:hypothetical protein